MPLGKPTMEDLFFAYQSYVLQCCPDLLFFYVLPFYEFDVIHLFNLFSTYRSFCGHTEDGPRAFKGWWRIITMLASENRSDNTQTFTQDRGIE